MKKLVRNKTLSLTLVMILLINLFGFGLILPNKVKAAAPIIPSLLPKPVSYEQGTGQFTLTSNTSIYVAGNSQDETDEIYNIAKLLVEKLNSSTGFNINIIKSNNPQVGSMYFTTINGNSEQGNEGYSLVTETDKVTLSAYKPEGIFRGEQTLIQLLPADILKSTAVIGIPWVIPNSRINDKPSYSYRGLMLDVARHFFTVNQVKRQIDLASQYKINKLHLHLTDDQGWRIEIKSRPDLITYGSISAVNHDQGGYYTQEQLKDIISYANARYIEVIPEIDMPGHTNAALSSIPELNPSGVRAQPRYDTAVGYSSLMARSEATYAFVDDVISELAAISPSPYIHIGGDESNSTTAADYDYFIGRVASIANKYGKKVVGWDPYDTSTGITSNDSILQNWHCTPTTGTSAISKGMKMILSPANAYIDQKYYSNSPLGLSWRGFINTNKAYTWDPTDFAPAASIYGIESTLWTETVVTGDNMDYLIYPRLIANAEVGWTPKNLRNWNDFKTRLYNHAPSLENKGIKYFADPIAFTPPAPPINSKWKMDEGTGITAADSSGRFNATLLSTTTSLPTWTIGKFGSAVSLNGTSQYLSLGGTEITGDWTLGMWVNGRSNTTKSAEALVSGPTSSIKANQWNKTGKVGFSVFGVKDSSFNYKLPTTNTWVHLTFVGTSAGTSLYVNGVLQQTLPDKLNCPMSYVGAEIQPGTGSKTSFFEGSIDQLTIVDRALSASEIVALTKSPIATLSSITLNGKPLNGFATQTTDYNVMLPAGTTEVPTVAATASDSNAKVEVTNPIALPGNTSINVTSEDGTTTKLYNIHFSIDQLNAVTITADQTVLSKSNKGTISISGKLDSGLDADLTKATILYKSSNSEVVTVDDSGNIIPNKEGNAVITASVNLFGTMIESNNIPIVVDNTAPVTTAIVNGSGANGWYHSNVSVTLNSNDNLSGSERTEYRINGSGDWIPYMKPVNFDQEGVYTLEFRSIDKVGNKEETNKQTIKIDKTMAHFNLTVNGQPINDGASFDDYLPLSFNASDDLSGIASAKIQIAGEVYSIDTKSQQNIDIDMAGKPGSFTALVILGDVAGNHLETSINVNVTTNTNSMKKLVSRYINSDELNGPIIAQLTNKLDQVEHQLDKGMPDQAAKHLQDFLGALNNKALESYSSENAKAVLNTDALNIINNITVTPETDIEKYSY
ncbi:family 20 glycosylhydrolase [Gottfriedia acidiceleris]|uniref:family 20 glycosylhydrolase n=1 Tax=Gottfriedia acidiceleris TaxID=371036 RepID=UPI00101BFE58|nr:family 20 glycosylhydrolase [Gottfriedia acidiceleris]